MTHFWVQIDRLRNTGVEESLVKGGLGEVIPLSRIIMETSMYGCCSHGELTHGMLDSDFRVSVSNPGASIDSLEALDKIPY